jgi:putative membrane protein
MIISSKEPVFLAIAISALLIASAINPQADRLTWLLETAPVFIGLSLAILSYRRFTLTILLYRLLAIHAVILIVGGYYTYAEVPLFNWLRDSLELSRNHYDRIGHFAQGFVPAILAREILLRRSPLEPGKWLFFLVTCVCLGVSAFYEMIEWWAALINERAAAAFLGTQGDVWDTQWDMFLALTGALSSQLLLAHSHDSQLSRMHSAEHVGSNASHSVDRP